MGRKKTTPSCPGKKMPGPDEPVTMDQVSQETVDDEAVVVVVAAEDITVNDVILGRGSRIARYPGNANLRTLVGLYRNDYHHTKRTRKHTVSAKVVEHIGRMDPPGRFLTAVEGEGGDDGDAVYYTLTPLWRAVEKVSQALREKPRGKDQQQQQQQVDDEQKNGDVISIEDMETDTLSFSSASSASLVDKKMQKKEKTPVKKNMVTKSSKKKKNLSSPEPPVVVEEKTFTNRYGRIIRLKSGQQQPKMKMMPAPARRVTDPWRCPSPSSSPSPTKQQLDIMLLGSVVSDTPPPLPLPPRDEKETIINVDEKTKAQAQAPTTSLKSERQEEHVPVHVLLLDGNQSGASVATNQEDEDVSLDEEVDTIMSSNTPSATTTTTTTTKNYNSYTATSAPLAASSPIVDKDVDYTTWSFYQYQQQREQDALEDEDIKLSPFFAEDWMLIADHAASDLCLSFPPTSSYKNSVAVKDGDDVAATENKTTKMTPSHLVPPSPETVVKKMNHNDMIVSVKNQEPEEQGPCEFVEPSRQRFTLFVEKDHERLSRLSQQLLPSIANKDEECTVIVSSSNAKQKAVLLHGQQQDDHDDDDDDRLFWPLPLLDEPVFMDEEEDDDDTHILGLSGCSSFLIEESNIGPLDVKHLLFELAGDHDLDHHHHHHHDDDLFFQDDWAGTTNMANVNDNARGIDN